MRLFERNGWHRVTYQLIYPGILGSLIFDLRDPLRGWTSATWGGLFIVIAYTFDYLHLTEDLKHDRKTTGWFFLIDDFIALLFCFGAFFMTTIDVPINEGKFHYSIFVKCACCLACLFTAFLAISLNDIVKLVPDQKRWASLVPPLILAVGTFAIFLSPEPPPLPKPVVPPPAIKPPPTPLEIQWGEYESHIIAITLCVVGIASCCYALHVRFLGLVEVDDEQSSPL